MRCSKKIHLVIELSKINLNRNQIKIRVANNLGPIKPLSLKNYRANLIKDQINLNKVNKLKSQMLGDQTNKFRVPDKKMRAGKKMTQSDLMKVKWTKINRKRKSNFSRWNLKKLGKR